MNITSILLFIILMLVVGADFLFSKLKKKDNTDILKIDSQKEEKPKSRFFSFPTKNKILIGLVLVWIAFGAAFSQGKIV